MKRTNKDTIKAIDAAKTLIEYCARYKDCENCIFHCDYGFLTSRCAINEPFKYVEINEGGGQ